MRKSVFTVMAIITIGVIALAGLYVATLVGFRRAYLRRKEIYMR